LAHPVQPVTVCRLSQFSPLWLGSMVGNLTKYNPDLHTGSHRPLQLIYC